jgi:acyl-CoA thioesterase FadM
MNLYLRLLWTLLRSWRLPKMGIHTTLERQLRVLPNDLDINAHMNNGRYLTVIDLLLIEFFVRTGFAHIMLKQGWRPMSGGAIISYRRALAPLESYSVRFRYTGSDTAWNYMGFEFVNQQGKICAAGYMKGAAVSKQGLVPTETYQTMLGVNTIKRQLAPAVQHWLAAEHSVMEAASA